MEHISSTQPSPIEATSSDETVAGLRQQAEKPPAAGTAPSLEPEPAAAASGKQDASYEGHPPAPAEGQGLQGAGLGSPQLGLQAQRKGQQEVGSAARGVAAGPSKDEL
jgi:hypothetical protein